MDRGAPPRTSPPHNIAIHVESVDPQPDGEKSVRGDSVMARGSRNPLARRIAIPVINPQGEIAFCVSSSK